MPSVAEEQPRMAPGKKRRRDNDAIDLPMPLGSGPQELFSVRNNNERLIVENHGDHSHMLNSMPRKIMPLPAAKRACIFDGEDLESHNYQPDQPFGFQRRSRHSRSPSYQRALQDQTDAGNRPQPMRTNSALLLTPCHICHRRLTKKSDLDSFADCEGCGQRTCFVCIRACPGWVANQRPEDDVSVLEEDEVLSRSFHMDDAEDAALDTGNKPTDTRNSQGNFRGGGGGEARKPEHGWASGGHRKMVCSRCCIEKGAEGDVVCLGCLSQMEAV